MTVRPTLPDVNKLVLTGTHQIAKPHDEALLVKQDLFLHERLGHPGPKEQPAMVETLLDDQKSVVIADFTDSDPYARARHHKSDFVRVTSLTRVSRARR